jgi:lysophospholipase L1-like esterase
MKTILCYGDSITWGYDPKDGSRFPPDRRWPGILQDELGPRARVIEEALNSRTVATDDPIRPYRNGLAMLPPLLEAHAPLDIVIFMLGTNDCAPCYRLTAGEIAFGCVGLIRAVKASLSGPAESQPKIVLVSPPLLGDLNPELALFYGGGEDVSRQLAHAYGIIAHAFGCTLLDAAELVEASKTDGVHLDPPEQRKLALALKDIVEPML